MPQDVGVIGDTTRGGDGRTCGAGVNYRGLDFRTKRIWLPECNPLPNMRLENPNGARFSVMLTGKGSFGDPAWDQVKLRRGRLAPREELLSAMDLEKQVSTQPHELPTASTCVYADKTVGFCFQRTDSIPKHTGTGVPYTGCPASTTFPGSRPKSQQYFGGTHGCAVHHRPGGRPVTHTASSPGHALCI